MKARDLRNSILQMAVQGKLVPQDPTDEPASILLERIRAERAQLIKEKKIKAPKGGESVIYRASDGSHYEKRGKGEPVCIDDEIPFEIPESWAWVRLGSILELVSDGTHKTPEYKDSGVLFLSVQNVSKGYFDLSKVKYVSRETHDELCRRVKPRNRDILLCRIGTLGKPIIVDVDYEFSIFVSLGLLRLIDERLAEWVVACIDAPIGFQWIQRVKVGGGTHTFKINLGDIPHFLIPLPPYEEQLRIREKLSAILDYVGECEELQATRENLDTELPDRLRKSILQMAVQGKLVPQDPADEPASALLGRIRDERAKLVKEKKTKAPKGGESVIYREGGSWFERRGKSDPVCIDDEIPFEIPESWEWVRMGSVLTFVNGRAYKKPELLDKGKYPVLRVGNLFTNNAWYYSDLELPKEKYCHHGDLLYAWSASFGPTIWQGETCIFHYHIWNVVHSEELDREYLYWFLMEDVNRVKRFTTGSTMIHVSMENMMPRLLAIPPLEEQKRIAAKINELLATITEEKDKNA